MISTSSFRYTPLQQTFFLRSATYTRNIKWQACFIYDNNSLQTLLTPSASQRHSISSATLLRAAFCSSPSRLGNHFAATFHFFTILKTEAVGMFASCVISSHDLRRYSSNRVLTINTDVSSFAVTGRPLLGSSWMLNRPSRKRDAHRDTVLRSTVPANFL